MYMGSNINITPQPHPMLPGGFLQSLQKMLGPLCGCVCVCVCLCVCACVCVVNNGYRSMVNGGGTSAQSLGTHHSPYILYSPPTTMHVHGVKCSEQYQVCGG